MLRDCVVVVLILCAGLAQGCVTDENTDAVNGTVYGILGQLAGNGHFDLATQEIKTSVPEVLTFLCNTTLDLMKQLETQIGACPQLLTSVSSLSLLQIEGVSISQLFTAFTGVENFCSCQSSLPAAWHLKASATQLTYEDPTAIYPSIADNGNICGAQMKMSIDALAGASTDCRTQLLGQAGFSNSEEREKFERISQLASTYCAYFDEGHWTCVKNKSASDDLKNCMQTSFATTGDGAACGKRVCVLTFIGNDANRCGAQAADVYIKLVNVENPAALLESDCSNDAVTCITYQKLNAINTAVGSIFMGLNVDLSSGIQDDQIPAIFNALCTNTSLKAAMTVIETEIKSCPNLVLLTTMLGLLNIKGTSFAELFAMFPDVDTFCQCSTGLLKAWQLKSDTTSQVYEDPLAAYLRITHVSNICGGTLNDLIVSVGGASTSCKQILKSQANNTNFDALYAIADACKNDADIATDWTCMMNKAKTSDFKLCINAEGNKVGDGALCGKRECVLTEMHECSNMARDLYIKAVNIENPNRGIKEIAGHCGACGLHLSFSLVVAYLAFLLV